MRLMIVLFDSMRLGASCPYESYWDVCEAMLCAPVDLPQDLDRNIPIETAAGVRGRWDSALVFRRDVVGRPGVTVSAPSKSPFDHWGEGDLSVMLSHEMRLAIAEHRRTAA